MKIAIYPWKINNKYIDIIKNCIESSGIEVYDCKVVLKSVKLFNKIDVFHFNWIESNYTKKHFLAIFKYFYKCLILLFIKLNGKSIVWTIHNKVPHNECNSNLSKMFMIFLIKISDKIIIHSSESKKVILDIIRDDKYLSKVTLINHPNYIGEYNKTSDNFRDKYNIKCEELVFLAVGSISEYKNIDVLIKAFIKANCQNSKLLIAGRVCSDEYKEYLTNLSIYNKNIIFDFNYVSDDDLIKFINTADIVVTPYNLDSSLNSGSAILAFSNRKTVLSTLNGTIMDILKYKFTFSYSFKNIEEHENMLIKRINQIKEIYDSNNDELRRLGEKAYHYVKNECNKEKIGEELSKLYLNIIFK